jgi:hypothetical protein
MRWMQVTFGLRHQAALKGGRSPIQWQEELQKMADLNALRQAVSWIGSWEAAVNFQLRNGPFLGQTLGELFETWSIDDSGKVAPPSVGRIGESRRDFASISKDGAHQSLIMYPAAGNLPERLREDFTEEREPAPRKGAPQWSKLSFTNLQQMQVKFSSAGGLIQTLQISGIAQPQEPDLASEKIQKAFQMGRVASRALLSRLARNVSLDEEQSLIKDHWTLESSLPQNRVSAGISKDKDAQKKWLQDQAENALDSIHRLNSDLLSLPSRLAEAPTWLQTTENRMLEAQWSLPLAGPMAPSDLLAEMAGLSRGHPDDFENRRQNKSGRKGILPTEAERSFLAYDEKYSPTELMPRFDFSPSAQSETGLQLPLSFRCLRWPSVRSSAIILDRLKHQGSQINSNIKDTDIDLTSDESARAAQPIVAQYLPSLLPPQSNKSSILPIAANTARLGAQKEALGAEDDLSILAAKIKRILDEEARRLGISV